MLSDDLFLRRENVGLNIFRWSLENEKWFTETKVVFHNV